MNNQLKALNQNFLSIMHLQLHLKILKVLIYLNCKQENQFTLKKQTVNINNRLQIIINEPKFNFVLEL